jgi:hypothetical protein
MGGPALHATANTGCSGAGGKACRRAKQGGAGAGCSGTLLTPHPAEEGHLLAALRVGPAPRIAKGLGEVGGHAELRGEPVVGLLLGGHACLQVGAPVLVAGFERVVGAEGVCVPPVGAGVEGGGAQAVPVLQVELGDERALRGGWGWEPRRGAAARAGRSVQRLGQGAAALLLSSSGCSAPPPPTLAMSASSTSACWSIES